MQRKFRFETLFIFILFYLLYYGYAFGASFDCTKALNIVEKIICAAPEVSMLDEKMAKLYFEAKDYLAYEQKGALINQQRAFILVRNKCAQQVVGTPSVDDIFLIRDCLTSQYKKRIKELENINIKLSSAKKINERFVVINPQQNEANKCADWNVLDFVYIPGGEFSMGENEGMFSDESPKHIVTVQEFCIMKEPLSSIHINSLISIIGNIKLKSLLTTTLELQQRLKDIGYNPGVIDGRYGSKTANANLQFQSENNLPETGKFDERTKFELSKNSFRPLNKFIDKPSFTYQEAIDIANALTNAIGVQIRLPTEAEWEYVANRGTDPNNFGIKEILRNWQLTSSIYMPYPYNFGDGREDPENIFQYRVLRGGSTWDPDYTSITLRGYASPGSRYSVRFVMDKISHE